jgi:hypothetical protein
MSLDEMVGVVSSRATRNANVSARLDWSSANHPKVRIASQLSPRWAEVELDFEIFFLTVDAGYRLVQSELWSAEQAALLRKLADIAVAYVEGRFHLATRVARLTRRTRTELVVRVNDMEYHFRPVPGTPRHL